MRRMTGVVTHSFFACVNVVIHPILALSEDRGTLHSSRCNEITKMMNHIMITHKIPYEYLIVVCTSQSFINTRKLLSYERINCMLNKPLGDVDDNQLNQLTRYHHKLFEDLSVFPRYFKINSFKHEYRINFVCDYLSCPEIFKVYILKLCKIIFSSKKLKHEKASKKSLRVNVLKKNFLKKKFVLEIVINRIFCCLNFF